MNVLAFICSGLTRAVVQTAVALCTGLRSAKDKQVQAGGLGDSRERETPAIMERSSVIRLAVEKPAECIVRG